MQKSRAMRMVEAAGVALCVVQALRVLFSMLFGVIYDALFEGPFTIGAVVTIALAALVFLAPLLAPRRAAVQLAGYCGGRRPVLG